MEVGKIDPPYIEKKSRGDLLFVQYLWLSDLLHPRVCSTYAPFFESYQLASNSDPHATGMGCVETEPEFVHYSSNPIQPLLGFKSHHHGPIY